VSSEVSTCVFTASDKPRGRAMKGRKFVKMLADTWTAISETEIVPMKPAD
jgi:hypothetical protein